MKLPRPLARLLIAIRHCAETSAPLPSRMALRAAFGSDLRRWRLPAAALLSVTAVSGVLAYNLDGSRWEAGGTTFYVGIPGAAPTGQTWVSAFTEAMAEWTQRSAFNFSLANVYVDPCDGYRRSADGRNFPAGGGDTRNSVDFRSTVCGNDFGTSVLAITLNISSGGSLGFDYIVQSDILFNSAHNWDIYAGSPRSRIDFHRVALHELGHALGLNHESVNTSIMAPSLTSVDTLQADDIAGANAIYGGSFNCLVTALGLHARADAALETGDCRVMDLFTGSDDTSLVDVYSFRLAKQTTLNVGMASTGFDPVMIIANANLASPRIFEDSTGTCDARGSVTLPAGDYLLLANTYVEPVRCGGKTGSYSLTLTDSTQPVLGAIRNASGGLSTAATLITGGASTNAGATFRTSFAASESIEVVARVAPDPRHVGLQGSLYVLATLGDGRQFMKTSAGFVPFNGDITSLQAYRSGSLAALEAITVINDLRGNVSGLAGQSFRVHIGYARASSPRDIFYGSSPITFAISVN